MGEGFVDLKGRVWSKLRGGNKQLLSVLGKWRFNQSSCASNSCIHYELFSFASKFMRRSGGHDNIFLVEWAKRRSKKIRCGKLYAN
ncbi:hypothetical protein LguiB_016899 [Lonicera macranthoides]